MTAKAQIMIDGDHAIALLGPDLQAGEAYACKSNPLTGRGTLPLPNGGQRNKLLRTRVGQPELAFTLDCSHPDFDISG